MQCFITRLNTEKRVENTTRSGVFFDELRGVSSGDETLCRMFDICSQTKSFLKEKLRMQILSSVSFDFQTLIKH